jgi:hypothetical protein
LVFAPSSLILTNCYLPLSEALCAKGVEVMLRVSILILSIVTFYSHGVESKLSESYFYNSGFDSTKELSLFIQELQSDVSQDNKKSVALKVSYPLTVHLPDTVLGIKNPDDFVKHYDDIITENIKRILLSQSINDLGRFTEGVRLGHGEVWISSVKNNVSDKYRIKVVSFNVRNGT